MPGRRGYSSSTGWNSGSPGSTLPQNPSYNGRSNNTPLEYRATGSIEFTPGFESGEGDSFEAYITQGGSGGEGSELTGSGIYRYGFNGKENDDEVKGEGNQQDYGMRIYDPRLGRWSSLDPKQTKYPYESHYSFVGNSPLLFKDPDGRDKIVTIINKDSKGISVQVKVDKNYFHAEAQSKLSGGYDFVKYNVSEIQVYEKGKLISTSQKIDYSNPKDIGAFEYASIKTGLNGLGSRNQYVKDFGYVLTGNRAGNGWTVDLGGDAIHKEILDIGLMIEGTKNLREFEGKQEIADAFEVIFGKRFKPLQEQTFNILDNLDDAKGAIQNVTGDEYYVNPDASEPTTPAPKSYVNPNKPKPVKFYNNGKPAPNEKGPGQSLRKTPEEGTKPDTIFYDKPKKG